MFRFSVGLILADLNEPSALRPQLASMSWLFVVFSHRAVTPINLTLLLSCFMISRGFSSTNKRWLRAANRLFEFLTSLFWLWLQYNKSKMNDVYKVDDWSSFIYYISVVVCIVSLAWKKKEYWHHPTVFRARSPRNAGLLIWTRSGNWWPPSLTTPWGKPTIPCSPSARWSVLCCNYGKKLSRFILWIDCETVSSCSSLVTCFQRRTLFGTVRFLRSTTWTWTTLYPTTGSTPHTTRQ